MTAPVSGIFQGMNNDILNAKNCYGIVIFYLENKCTNCLSLFGDANQECVLLMNEMDIEVKIPRLLNYEIKRSKHLVNNMEDYCRALYY